MVTTSHSKPKAEEIWISLATSYMDKHGDQTRLDYKVSISKTPQKDIENLHKDLFSPLARQSPKNSF